MRYNREKKELTFDEAKDKALRLLEFRSHSERELSDKLKRAGAKEEDIDEILEFCRNYGFLDDRKYAIAKAKDLKNLKKYGKRRIKSELYSKGIDAEYVEEAVSYLDEDEEDMLLPLVEKRLKGDFEKKNIDKCIRYFMYRGYGFSDIKHRSCFTWLCEKSDRCRNYARYIGK